jgi:hypothetical protein
MGNVGVFGFSHGYGRESINRYILLGGVERNGVYISYDIGYHFISYRDQSYTSSF